MDSTKICHPICPTFPPFFDVKYKILKDLAVHICYSHSRCPSVLDFWNVNLGVYYKLKKKSSLIQTRFFVKFELDFYCLCSLQKSISKSNWFSNFLNSIFRNWKKIKWHSIFQKSSGDRQGYYLNRN